MDSQLEIKLIECLSLLDQDEPLDRILARYPDDAASLRPLLETAIALAALRQEPSEMARIASRRVFLGQAHQLRESAAQRRFWLPRRMAIAIAALVFAFIFMGGAVAASASALPHEPLYGVKRAVEDARLLVASGAEKDQLAASFEQRRRDEIKLLLVLQRDTLIAFDGTIESMQPNGLDISGLYVHLDRATTVAGTPAIGQRAEVQGRTEGGQLIASFIRVEPGSNPTASPALQPTATLAARETASATRAPSARPSPQPEITRQPQSTARPAAGSPPTPSPTNTPRPPTTAVPPSPVPPTPVPPSPVPPTPVPPSPAPPAPVEEIEFSGVVEAIGTTWSVSGTPVEIDGGTEIRDTINVGDRVKVRALRLSNGRLIAQRIERQDDSNDNSNGNDDHGGNGNDNSNSGSGGGNDNGGGNGNGGGGDDNSGSGGGGGNDNGGGNGGGGHGSDDKP